MKDIMYAGERRKVLNASSCNGLGPHQTRSRISINIPTTNNDQ